MTPLVALLIILYPIVGLVVGVLLFREDCRDSPDFDDMVYYLFVAGMLVWPFTLWIVVVDSIEEGDSNLIGRSAQWIARKVAGQ